MFENKLIEEVRRQRCLYDRSIPAYRNKHKKDKAWQSVAANARTEVEQCKNRWRSLRDRFVKEVAQKANTDSAASAKHTWIHLDAMMFIRNYIVPRKQKWKIEDRRPSSLISETEYFESNQDVAATPTEYSINDFHQYDSTQAVEHVSTDTPSTSGLPHKRRISEAHDPFQKTFEAESRNANFLKVFDEYLSQLPEDIQDELKITTLNIVFAEISKRKSIRQTE